MLLAASTHPGDLGDLSHRGAGEERFPGIDESSIVTALQGVPLVLHEDKLSARIVRLSRHIPA